MGETRPKSVFPWRGMVNTRQPRTVGANPRAASGVVVADQHAVGEAGRVATPAGFEDQDGRGIRETPAGLADRGRHPIEEGKPMQAAERIT